MVKYKDVNEGTTLCLEPHEEIVTPESPRSRDFEIFYKGQKINNVTALVLTHIQD